jgi:hypothetical protein
MIGIQNHFTGYDWEMLSGYNVMNDTTMGFGAKRMGIMVFQHNMWPKNIKNGATPNGER